MKEQARRLIFAIAVAVAGAIPSAHAQPLLIERTVRPANDPAGAFDETRQIVDRFRDWQVLCPLVVTDDRLSCEIAPAAIAPKADSSDQAAAGASLEMSGQLVTVPGERAPSLVVVLTTPLGWLLPKGLKLQIDGGAPFSLAFRSCHADGVRQGCLVPFRPSGAIRRQLINGLDLTITAYALDGSEREWTVSLRGFTRALQSLENG